MTETTNPITQKDLELLDDIVPAEDKPAEPAVDAAKPAEKESAKGGDGLFDGLDDDDGDDKPKGKPADSEAADDKAKPADGDDAKGKEDGKGEADKAADEAWRERVADKLLAGVKDKLSAAKFEKRREQLLTQFKRYKSPDDAIAAGVMAQEKLRSGEHKKLSEEASPEEAAAWRKENDIPEDPAKYDIPAIPGHTWKDADTPTLDGFKAAAHEANLPQSAVNRLTKWWVEQQQNSEAEYDSKLKALDRQDKEACHDALRTEFGISEFKPSLSVMKRFIEDEEVFGEGMADILVGSRYFDEETGMWRRLTSHPSFARGLIGLATERYGDGAMVAGDGRPSVTANRLDEIEKIMKTDSDRYFREGLADEAMAIRQKQEEREAKRASRR
jgi:hypothetical protein